MKKLYHSSMILAVLSAVFLFGSAAVADESAPASEQSQQTEEVTETLKKTTHGRSMLSRDDGGDAESGRFMRALSASIRYFTGSSK